MDIELFESVYINDYYEPVPDPWRATIESLACERPRCILVQFVNGQCEEFTDGMLETEHPGLLKRCFEAYPDSFETWISSRRFTVAVS